MSPWDLEPIDEERRPREVGAGVPVLPSEIVGTLYRPRPEDWGGDRDSECKRISAALSQVMKLAIAEPFTSPIDLNLCPYPMDLGRFIRSQLRLHQIQQHSICFHHQGLLSGDDRNPRRCRCHLPTSTGKL